MNRRSILKAAAAGVAACCGVKLAKAKRGPKITFPHSFYGKITGVYWSGINSGAMSRNDARLLETRKFDVADIKRWYRIPDGMI